MRDGNGSGTTDGMEHEQQIGGGGAELEALYRAARAEFDYAAFLKERKPPTAHERAIWLRTMIAATLDLHRTQVAAREFASAAQTRDHGNALLELMREAIEQAKSEAPPT